MLHSLPSGLKISISRSISTVFEQYMEKIGWDEKKYNIEDFIKQWQVYINEHASWYDKLSDDIKKDPSFHEELAAKINETIQKILSEAPTDEQMKTIENLQRKHNNKDSYSCKMEAKFLINSLKSKTK
ncbi:MULTISPECIES: hypothetical protein [Heyndrickxia]|jgi:hypothetical protein|uniref:Uncharacterized protein n=1 Tax=Heyndrickxia oleronia TaxID=38875 RepID=A0A8E2IBV3_9BACI|nr:hypothetical protein [Heyndrickxia oleronia]NYV65885.1 hypothetical protein [Bacillus sp. Gen3]OJH16543.1 hypothetical protein BLX88_23560 [Bacillus obstructivus]MBU5214623.1 hypothetical protein [Heyndrickxia oleronia]MCI1589290.1 hypothetical protein [Heyndrickxia oleronia]MCI1612419.1 hypothetical protein [Heyndrickxia oleronia]